MPTIEHVKGSELTGAWARDLNIRPDRHYVVSVQLDSSSIPSKKGLSDALDRAAGIWEDRPEIQEEMAQMRREADRY